MHKPINITDKTFIDQMKDLTDRHKSYCTASALFYWGDGGDTGLRVEVPFLAKEFIDNVDFGHDPEGLLFYDSSTQFDIPLEVTWKCTMNQENPPAVRVDFLAPHARVETVWASFITKDTDGAIAHLRNYAGEGKGSWVDSKMITCYAQLDQFTPTSPMALDLKLIGKFIEWQPVAPTDDADAATIIGNFSFRNFSDIKEGTVANINYNEDRIIFYNSSKKMLGVFFPSKPNKGSNPIANVEGTFVDVKTT